MTFQPALRAQVALAEEAAKWMVSDALTDHKVEVSGIVAEVARRLDGTRAWDDVAAELEAAGFTREHIDGALRRLLLLNFTVGAGDEIIDKYQRLVAGAEKLPHLILEGARFQCQGSGECCQNYAFGPLEASDVERLAALDIAGAFPRLAGAPYLVEHKGRGDEPQPYLATVDNRCVFLEDDYRCGLHARFGAAAKPNLCRLYPLEQLPTLDGVKLYDKGSCATFAVSSRSGPPLVEELVQLRKLLYRRHDLYHPVVFIDDDLACDYGHFLRWLRSATDLVRAGRGNAAETLRAIGQSYCVFGASLRICPLAPGEPDTAVGKALTGDWYAGTPDDDTIRRGAAAFATACSELVESLGEVVLATNSDDKYRVSARLYRELVEILHLVGQVAAAAADPALVLDGYCRKIKSLPVGDAEIDQVLRLSIRQQLFGHGALICNRPAPALLRIALIQLCAIYGARLRASVEGRDSVAATDLSYGHHLAVRMLGLHHVEIILLRHNDAALDALDALPTVAQLRPMP